MYPTFFDWRGPYLHCAVQSVVQPFMNNCDMHVHCTRNLRPFGFDISRAVCLAYQTRLKNWDCWVKEVVILPSAPEVGMTYRSDVYLEAASIAWAFRGATSFGRRHRQQKLERNFLRGRLSVVGQSWSTY